MKKNLSDFAVLNKNAISSSLCDLAVKELKESPNWRRHTFTKYVDGQRTDSSTEHDPYQHDADLPTVIPDLMKAYWDVIYKYVDKDTGFNWFTTWQGFEPLKFIQYTPNTEMRIHCDHIHSMFDGHKKGVPILTLIGLFNDNFKGGEFVLFDDEVIPMEKGDVLIFPSSFLYPHTVQKVTEGVRYSAASWVF
jgi:predicted 2-oxoglutarate/Fe(II)-dependent dioxygenase YbiX